MKTKVTAADIRAALRLHFPNGSHAVLEEVRNGTGYRRTERYADALVCSCWPSRGLWLAGVEIKVSRSDWRKELEQPDKSAEIQKWCDYWWIAAPKGLVKDGELPVTWGLLEYDAKARAKSKIAIAVQAPKLDALALSIEFVASVLRSATKLRDDEILAIRNESWQQARKELGELDELTTKLAQAESRIRLLEHYEKDAKLLRAEVRELREQRDAVRIKDWKLRELEQQACEMRAAADAIDAVVASAATQK
jgi:hypothetical protein